MEKVERQLHQDIEEPYPQHQVQLPREEIDEEHRRGGGDHPPGDRFSPAPTQTGYDHKFKS